MNKYDDCTYCGGRVSERIVQKIFWWGEKVIAVVDNVPEGFVNNAAKDIIKLRS